MVSGHCLSVVVLFTFSTIHPAIRLSCYPPMRPPMRPPIHSLLQSPSYILKSLIFASSTHHIHPSVHPWYTNLAWNRSTYPHSHPSTCPSTHLSTNPNPNHSGFSLSRAGNDVWISYTCIISCSFWRPGYGARIRGASVFVYRRALISFSDEIGRPISRPYVLIKQCHLANRRRRQRRLSPW